MIERLSRGTQDIIKFCKEAGNPKPKFIELSASFAVILPLKKKNHQIILPANAKTWI
jgi:predicted HTH transcriptional regulator